MGEIKLFKKKLALVTATLLAAGMMYGCADTPAEEPVESGTAASQVIGDTTGTGALQLEPPKAGDTIATVSTSEGDILVKLFPEQAPLAVENFVEHANNEYFNDFIFHRIIEGFMIQTGDPTGTGMGGESIWNEEFDNEYSADLNNISGALAMANSGPDTNGSQFYIVAGAADSVDEATAEMLLDAGAKPEVVEAYKAVGGSPSLDGGYTVFGQVYSGLEIVYKISQVETDSGDKPLEDVVLKGITISTME